MVEIEGDETVIKKIALQIAPNHKFKNYRLKDLIKKEIERTGKDLSQLKREYFQKTGFDLGKIELLLS